MNGAFKHKAELNETPDRASRPFSADRKGFIISEGAGCTILTTRKFASANSIPYDVGIAGWGMTSDANHFVAPNLDTVKTCIDQSIEKANIHTSEIAAIKAHATSTKVGDKVEFDAIKQVFGNNIPRISANKSFLGHAMGASSAIESILTIEGMKQNKLLPTINYTPDPDIEINCATGKAIDLEQEFVLKNSFGFGGCNTCIVFQRL